MSANDGGKWWRRHTGSQPRVAYSLGRRIQICRLFTACKPGLADNQMAAAGIPGRVPVRRRNPLSVVAGSTNKRSIFIRLFRNAKCLARVHVSCALVPLGVFFFFLLRNRSFCQRHSRDPNAFCKRDVRRYAAPTRASVGFVSPNTHAVTAGSRSGPRIQQQ